MESGPWRHRLTEDHARLQRGQPNEPRTAIERLYVATLQVSEHWGTFNSVWRMQNDGSWKVVFDAGNEAAEAPSEEIQALLDGEADCP